MGNGGSAIVQELAKITGLDWQLCQQALDASNNDAQRYVSPLPPSLYFSSPLFSAALTLASPRLRSQGR